jgi:hypothetical protein
MTAVPNRQKAGFTNKSSLSSRNLAADESTQSDAAPAVHPKPKHNPSTNSNVSPKMPDRRTLMASHRHMKKKSNDPLSSTSNHSYFKPLDETRDKETLGTASRRKLLADAKTRGNGGSGSRRDLLAATKSGGSGGSRRNLMGQSSSRRNLMSTSEHCGGAGGGGGGGISSDTSHFVTGSRIRRIDSIRQLLTTA